MEENQISPTPTINSPQTTVTQTVDQKPKKNNFLVVLLSILLFISLVITGFFAYQTQKLVKELADYRLQTTVIPTPEPESTFPMYTEPSPDPTVDWKTYANQEFSFKYPKDVSLDEILASNLITIAFITELEDFKNLGGSSGDPSFMAIEYNQPLKISEVPFGTKILEQSDVLIDNKKAKRYFTEVNELQNGYNMGDKITRVIYKDSSSWLGITLIRQEQTQIFDQILSTFKFTN